MTIYVRHGHNNVVAVDVGASAIVIDIIRAYDRDQGSSLLGHSDIFFQGDRLPKHEVLSNIGLAAESEVEIKKTLVLDFKEEATGEQR